LLQDRLSARGLIKGASWHHNINSTIKCLGLNIMGDIQSRTEALRRYDLMQDPERSLRWENDAREQLALDLALSEDVFSGQPFLTLPDGSSELEAMTKTLSLGSEPPGVNFGYLRPVLKSPADHYHTTTEEDEVESFNGVRALLKDWVIGKDPQIPDRDGTMLTESTLPSAARSAKVSHHLSSSQRPPAVVASTVVPPYQVEGPKRGFKVGLSQVPGIPKGFGLESQPVVTVSEPLDSSQEYVTNTQIVPGPYGGRASLGKKKITKKRLGGF
jgi:hypothetical protein